MTYHDSMKPDYPYLLHDSPYEDVVVYATEHQLLVKFRVIKESFGAHSGVDMPDSIEWVVLVDTRVLAAIPALLPEDAAQVWMSWFSESIYELLKVDPSPGVMYVKHDVHLPSQ